VGLFYTAPEPTRGSGLWRDSLYVTCGLTACTPGSTPGPTLGNDYGKALPFYLYLSGRGLPSHKLTIPQAACKLCALNLFFGRDNELQTCHINFILVDNKHRKLLAIKQSKGCKFMPEMHQNVWRPEPGPLGELMRSPGLLAAMGAYL